MSGFHTGITTDALLKISGQGAVYVRLLDKHNIESETDSSCDEEFKLHYLFVSLEKLLYKTLCDWVNLLMS